MIVLLGIRQHRAFRLSTFLRTVRDGCRNPCLSCFCNIFFHLSLFEDDSGFMNSSAPFNPSDGSLLRHQCCTCSLLVLVTLKVVLGSPSSLSFPPALEILLGLHSSASAVVLQYLASARGNSIVDGSGSHYEDCRDQQINVVEHSLDQILVSTSFVSCHQSRARFFFTEAAATMFATFLTKSPGRSVPEVKSNSVTEIFSLSAFCRLRCPSDHFAPTQISHHDRYVQCVNSCPSLSSDVDSCGPA